MIVLTHFKKQVLENIIQELIKLKNEYTHNGNGIEQDLLHILNNTEAFFKQIGESSLESKVSTLRNYISTAIQGINPQSLELIKTYKRKTIKSACFYCNTELSSILENELDKVNTLLTNSEKTIENIILTIIQTGNKLSTDIMSLDTIEKISHFWDRISVENEQIAFINMKLKLDILSQDIYILIDTIISKIKRT